MKVSNYKETYRLQACIFDKKWIPLLVFFKVLEKFLDAHIQRIALEACLRIQSSTFTKRV